MRLNLFLKQYTIFNMAKLFFGKIPSTKDPNQFKNCYVKATIDWLNGLNIGDYTFVGCDSTIALWKAKGSEQLSSNELKMNFEIIDPNIGFNTKVFRNLKGLILNPSLVLTQRQSNNKGFIELLLDGTVSLDQFVSKEFYTSESNFRKIIVHKTINEIIKDSSDLQLYYDNNELKLYHSSFISDQSFNDFHDYSSVKNGYHPRKDRVFELIANSTKSEFNVNELPIADLYDAYFCEYKFDNEQNNQKATTLNDTEKADEIIKVMNEANNENVIDYMNLLDTNKNIILHGAPGTGKTHTAKDIAAQMICHKNFSDMVNGSEDEKAFNEQTEFVQFHPSYDYSDFVEGLRPIEGDKSGDVGFERKDGVFKEFCIKALNNVNTTKKSVDEVKQEISAKEQIDLFLSKVQADKTVYNTANNNSFYLKSYDDKHVIINYITIDKSLSADVKIKYSDLIALFNANKIIDRTEVKTITARKVERQEDTYSCLLMMK